MSIRPAMVATLGLQPQVITRALDHLIAGGIEPDIEQVSIVHTRAFRPREPYWPSLEHFVQYLRTTYPTIKAKLVPIIDPEDDRVVYDVESPRYAQLAYTVLFNEIRRIKQGGHRIHGLLAGGRKSMIVYMMLSAQILFSEDDYLWHLFSTKETEEPHVLPEMREKLGIEGRALDESHLVDIPILHLAGFMPQAREMILYSNDPTRAMRLYHKQETIEQLVRLHAFYEQECDEIDREILHLAFSKGKSNREIGEQVGLGEAAVNSRISKMARKFYTPRYHRPLPEWPKHIRPQFYHDLRPLLMHLEGE